MVKRGDQLLPAGKIPADLLQRLLTSYANQADDRVIAGASIGIDAAAIAFGDTVLVVKSDPITFPTPEAGRYLVNVNANDVACLGADPRWMLVTALLPEGQTTRDTVEELFSGLSAAANQLGISLVGGHTEVTVGLDRPILSGTLLGETTREDLLDITTSRPGDAILLCRGVAIEGTAILAAEFREDLAPYLAGDLIERAASYVEEPGISVVPAARGLRRWRDDVRGLHDPTEGGIVSALHEIAEATGYGLEVSADHIQVLPETAAICEVLQVDPMGLIASGALLAIVDHRRASEIAETMTRMQIPTQIIGTLTDERERTLIEGDRRRPMPVFAVDEIARKFASIEDEEN